MDFLSEIIAVKKQRVAAAKARLPLERLRDLISPRPPSRSFARALSPDRINLIAEFKRRSPSKGKINSQADPAAVAGIYETAGADAISVLTEEDYFDGSLEDLRQVRAATWLPVLRKDFIFDEYQVYESAYVGANALLLIVAALDDATLTRLRVLAEDELGIDTLVEVHTKEELQRAVNCGARIIGVNNRDLRTFNVSIDTSKFLARLAPPNAILVSESGLNPEAVRELHKVGYRGFLVGETLMRAADPAAALREFIARPEGGPLPKRPWIKICGITSLEDARAAISAGADMLGFNFYRPSPRFIEPGSAAKIIRAIRSETRASRPSFSTVGVFVDESIETMVRIAGETGLDGIQLHGDETTATCRKLRELLDGRFVIKAVTVNRDLQLRDNAVDAILVDAFDSRQRGGTGRVADWSMARELTRKVRRVFLAGGLSPENVAEAIATVQPYGVDVCSSLEITPGKKSAQRMNEFVRAVRNVTLEHGTPRSSDGEGN